MLRKICLIVSATALAWLCWIKAGRLVVNAQNFQFQPNIVSLTAQQQEVYYGPDGREVHRQQNTIARRNDGSEVLIRQFRGPDGKPATNRLIVDLAKGRRIAVNGLAQAITTYEIDTVSADRMRSQTGDPRCGLKGDTRSVVVLGYPAIEGVQSMDGRSQEMQRSPALGCLELKVRGSQKQSTGLSAMTVREVTAVTLGEPDPSLFEVPDWPEMSPSEAHAAIQRRFPQAGTPPPSDQRLDDAYRSAPKLQGSK